jgi:hypothetical protein
MPNVSAVKTSYDPRLQVLLEPISIEKERVFVNPPVVSIGEGNSRLLTVQWRNNTKKVAWLWIPNGGQFFKKPSLHDFSTPFQIPPEPASEEERLTFTVRPDCQETSTEYQVYCESIPGYAEGHSPPVVKCP